MGVTINKKSTTTEPPPLNGQEAKPTEEFKVSQIMEFLYKLKSWVIKWSVCGETGIFSMRKGSVVDQLICVFLVNDRK